MNVIEIIPGGVVTKKTEETVLLDREGDFVYDPRQDICKLAVVERHHNTGSLAVGLIRGYGIKRGAVALTIAHDSHNIIVAGTNNEDMAAAVNALVKQQGGAVLVEQGKILESMALPVAGIMSDQTADWVDAKLVSIHKAAQEKLGVSKEVEPLMTLCFMALPVIPEIKLTDKGLFDVTEFRFIPVEVQQVP